jgi:RNA polymerase sigma-70 factor, ECF subfamily
MRLFMHYALSPARLRAPLARAQPLQPAARCGRRTLAFDADLVALLPSLKAYALSLCRNGAMADDLVQGASASAMASASSFQVGTSMRAWLFTILRNQYFSTLRKRRREVEDADGKSAEKLSMRPSQNDAVDLQDTMRAMRKLPTIHSDLLMLLGPSGFTYDDAAKKSGCAVGTIKSRAHRARGSLATMLAELERRGAPREIALC